MARAVLTRLDRQLRSGGHDDELVALRDDLLRYPDVRDIAAAPPEQKETPGLLIPIMLTLAGGTLSWYTTIASFGAPLDATLQEAVIESLLPADDETQRFVQQIGRRESAPLT